MNAVVNGSNFFNQWWYWPSYGLVMFVLFAPRKLKPWWWKHDRMMREFDSAPYRPKYAERESARFQAQWYEDITGRSSDPEVMRIEHERLLNSGCLDHGQSTPYSHWRWHQEQTRDFSPEERMMLRAGWLNE
jgi:hypothetical protein